MSQSLQHRIDIDGLRAFAVVSVLLFHADLLPGGFIGVDVFFVISGYLMASIITAAQNAHTFSIRDFYLKRARRVLPALFAVSSITALLACLLLLPSDVKDFGSSLISVSLLQSNYYFKDIALNYFDGGTVLTKPLLHTWTLGVEAQFYLLFPLLMLLPIRFKFNAAAFMIYLALLSLAYSQYLVIVNPQAAFYVFPSRFWELAVGAIACLIGQREGQKNIAAIGFLILVAACLSYNSNSLTFPGFAAIPPVAGAALILVYFRQETARQSWSANILKSWPVSGLARISYSLYLWHWPLFALARYRLGDVLPLWITATLLLLTFVLATLTYFYIERPFLQKKLAVRLQWAPLAFIAVLCIFGILVKNKAPKIVEAFLPADVMSLANGKHDRISADCAPWEKDTAPICAWGENTPDHILIGNSFARMWIPALSAAAKNNDASGIAAVQSGCNPFMNGSFQGSNIKDEACVAFNKQVFEFIKTNPHLKKVIIAADWRDGPKFKDNLETLISSYKALDKDIVLVLNPPHPGYQVPHVLANAKLRDLPAPEPILVETYLNQTGKIRTAATDLQSDLPLLIIDPKNGLCTDKFCPVQRDGRPLYSDKAHLTIFGAASAAKIFEDVF